MQVIDLPAATRPPAATESLPALPEATGLAGARALLVEDNELNLEVATELLRELGLTVDAARDGAIALRMVQESHYDIVLMDVQMPVMDGLTATAEIRRLPGFDKLPIVAMTANAMTQDRDNCLAAGMNDHIGKPIDPQLLLAKLQQWIAPCATPGAGEQVAAPAAPATGTGTPATACLDVARGLSLAMGRDKLYRSILGKFAAGQADAPVRIAQAIAAGQWEEAERAAHTLKGTAAQLGANGLSEVAGRLQHAIHDRAAGPDLAALQSELADALPGVLQAIETYLAGQA